MDKKIEQLVALMSVADFTDFIVGYLSCYSVLNLPISDDELFNELKMATIDLQIVCLNSLPVLDKKTAYEIRTRELNKILIKEAVSCLSSLESRLLNEYKIFTKNCHLKSVIPEYSNNILDLMKN